MNVPVLDTRTPDGLRQQFLQLARTYTPEWRLENAQEDPGVALVELFCHMLEESIDRMNSIPEKLYTDFINLIGFRLPAPVPAAGMMQFTVHDTVTHPVSVPAETQVFTSDAQGDNIVYETERAIEATPARLTGIYYADSETDRIERLDLTKPQRFFLSGGENLQRHRFWFGERDVLRVNCPCLIAVELRQEIRYLEKQTAAALAQMKWYYLHDNAWLPFDEVRAEAGKLLLEKRNSLSIDPDEQGVPCVCCEGRPEAAVVIEGIKLCSKPLERSLPDTLFSDDLPLSMAEGGYCFGKRPAPYSFFYIRSDAAFTKRGALVNLRLEIAPVVEEPPEEQPQYNYTQSIIDQRGEVKRKPDDVCVSDVIWEYYNGLGWRRLEVEGDQNPFSCQRDGVLETRFAVPQDIREIEVNAERGFYIRVRVTEVAHQYSLYARWIVPFLRTALLDWSYDTYIPAERCGAENNGLSTQIHDARQMTNLHLAALTPMAPAAHAMYLRFDRSPHAMPLSLLFDIVGRVPLSDELIWECCTGGQNFETISIVDLTHNMQHTGQVLLYLPDRLPETSFFGENGYWLRVSRSSSFDAPSPCVAAVHLNTVTARQTQREPDLYFSAARYDADKQILLMQTPVVVCDVWVDEARAVSLADARALKDRYPERVRLEWADSILTHCWVRWQQIADIALAMPEERVFSLDPYLGVIQFGNGRCGRVPTAGDQTIRVRYASGGGARGNVPAGQVNSLVGSLPRISNVVNLTPMCGGTDRFTRERIEAVGNKRLRHRGRAAGVHDYEELVLENFPQVQHVRCFPGRDAKGKPASGHVTVVVMGTDDSYAMELLCDRIFTFLSARCSCCLVAEERLHVCPAVLMTVSTHITVELEELDQAAEIQRGIICRIREQIDEVWRSRQIGSQIRMDDLWRVVRDTPGVRLVHRIQAEGAFDQDGQPQLVPLEARGEFPYAVVRSGTHRVRVRTDGGASW